MDGQIIEAWPPEVQPLKNEYQLKRFKLFPAFLSSKVA